MPPQSTVSSRERLEAVLDRLSARRGDERVFLKLYEEDARKAADASDRRRMAGFGLGPLDGVIVSIKDIFDVAGETTLAGSLIRRSAPPAEKDAEIVARLRRAGAVIVGRTNANEFCYTSDGINPHYGTPGNAADASRIPGGSSSGAGVSVAEGTSEIAIGSDTGGSVRIPAALNGVVGFKPTARRVSLAGVFPLSPSLDSVGPLARSVADCAAADAVMAADGDDGLASRPVEGLRIALPPAEILADTDQEIAAGFEDALKLLARHGAVLRQCAIEDLLAGMREATGAASIASVEAAAIHADWLRAGTEPVDRRTSRSLRRCLDFPEAAHREMLARRNALARAMDSRLAEFDALVVPTLPIFAPLIADMLADAKFSSAVAGLLLRNTQIVNQFDLTAVSLPMPGLSLPAGLTLVGRNGADRDLLALAAGVEALLAG